MKSCSRGGLLFNEFSIGLSYSCPQFINSCYIISLAPRLSLSVIQFAWLLGSTSSLFYYSFKCVLNVRIESLIKDYFHPPGPRRMSEREGSRNQADTTSITSSIAGQGSINGGVGAMFAKPPLPSPNSQQQHLPNSKSTPALHHVGNICK